MLIPANSTVDVFFFIRMRLTSCLSNLNMATGGKNRCGPLCQHPGCWHATEKVYRRPTDYLNYLNEIERRRKYDNGGVSKPTASHNTFDGLPTLKVNTLEHNEICDHRGISMHRQRQSKLLSSFTDAEKYQQVPFHIPALNEPKIHHVQMLLEDGKDDYNSLGDNKLMEISYTPVLLWKPRKQNQYFQPALKSPDTSLTLKKLHTQSHHSGDRSLSKTTTLPPTSGPQYQGSEVAPLLALEGVKR